jgi:hypothetical protein
MTFMDEIHRDAEESAMKAARTLHIWLSTISPADSEIAMSTIKDLERLSDNMKWPDMKDMYNG